MDWQSIAQYVELCVGFFLVVRLLSLHLHRVYRYFCVFLLADVFGIVSWLFQKHSQHTRFHFDYRISWLADQVIVWLFTLLTVYALLDAVLANLPGILKLSRRVLNVSFSVAIFAGLLGAIHEYNIAVLQRPLVGRLAHIITAAFVLDLTIASVALIVLISIFVFLLWFPVELSRNLAIFSTGFVFYFALKVCLMLSVTLRSPELIRLSGVSITFLSAGVFAYWAILISKVGESVPAKLSRAWQHSEEQLLIGQLEAINASLMRAVRR